LSAAGESTRKNEKTSAHTALGGKNARSDRRPKNQKGKNRSMAANFTRNLAARKTETSKQELKKNAL
jgi:hypothetical protein